MPANLPSEIAALTKDDWLKLGCYWLSPFNRRVSETIEEERGPYHDLLASFIHEYNVKPFKYGFSNLVKLLKTGSAPSYRIEAVKKEVFFCTCGAIGHAYGRGSPFDHVEMWGRNRNPLFLIGHPYNLDKEAMTSLESIRQLGLRVSIDTNSWYGYGTRRVVVASPWVAPANGGKGGGGD